MTDVRTATGLEEPYHRWTLIEQTNGLWRVETRNAISPRFASKDEAMAWLEDLYEDWQRAEASIYGGP